MFKEILNLHRIRTGSDHGDDEHEKMERLERAEAELDTLKARAAEAVSFLDSRNKRNSWAESINQMIHGAN